MQLYNTLSGQVDKISPPSNRDFGFYCCGPTVYGPTHIGNLRTFVLQDVLVRVLSLLNFPLRHVRNITDLDDKIIEASGGELKIMTRLSQGYIQQFHQDSDCFFIKKPQAQPLATEYLHAQISMIEVLLEKGQAYLKDGSVYFKVDTFKPYGKLSKPWGDELSDKRDFALWKKRKKSEGNIAWESPWGLGRPAWHLECSVMALECLGEGQVDLHGGGVDLLFPHHENEIAQSESYTDSPFCPHFFHTGHLLIQGEKMSKSLRNTYTLADFKVPETGKRGGHWVGAALRWVFLNSHYHSELNFQGQTSLNAATSWFQTYFYPFFEKFQGQLPRPTLPADHPLLDDLHTPRALAWLTEELQKFSKLSASQACKDALQVQKASELNATVQALLGLDLNDPQVLQKLKNAWHLPEEGKAGEAPRQLKALLKEREKAREAKDWEKADKLRAEIQAHSSWIVQDRGQQSCLRKGLPAIEAPKISLA